MIFSTFELRSDGHDHSGHSLVRLASTFSAGSLPDISWIRESLRLLAPKLGSTFGISIRWNYIQNNGTVVTVR